jgi:hypothetical protein
MYARSFATVFGMLIVSFFAMPANAQIIQSVRLDSSVLGTSGLNGEILDEILDDIDYALDKGNCGRVTSLRAELESFAQRAAKAGKNKLADEAIDALADIERECGPDQAEYVRVCDVYGQGFYYIPGTETALKMGDQARAGGCVQFGVQATYERQWIGGDSGIGTIVTAGDPWLAETKNWLSGGGAKLSTGFMGGGWYNRIEAGYSWADGESRGTDRGDGVTPAGYVPQDMANGNGWSSALLGGDFVGTTEVEQSRYDLSYSIIAEVNFDNGLAWGAPGDAWERESRKYFGYTLSLRHNEYDYHGRLEYTALPTFANVDVWQDLKSFEIGFGPVLGGRHQWRNGVYISGETGLLAILRRSEFSSYEVNCAPPAACTTTESRIEDDDTYFDGRGTIKAAIGWQPSANIDLSLFGQFELGGQEAVYTRGSPGDENTHSDRTWAKDWRVGVVSSIKF